MQRGSIMEPEDREVPPGWIVKRSKTGIKYYWNTVSQSAQWEKPKIAAESFVSRSPSPRGLSTNSSSASSISTSNQPESPDLSLGSHGLQMLPPPPPVAAKPKRDRYKVRIIHLLIKHNQSRTPLTRFNQPINRTKAEAQRLIAECYEKISLANHPMSEIAKAYSDCVSGYHSGQMNVDPPKSPNYLFQHIAYSLKVGELSHIFHTMRGYHLMKRVK